MSITGLLAGRIRTPKASFSTAKKATQLQRSALVYTPQVLLQGLDSGGGKRAFDEAWPESMRSAKARIALEIRSAGPQAMEIEARANCLTAAKRTLRALPGDL